MSRREVIECDACGKTIGVDIAPFAGHGIQEEFRGPNVRVRVEGEYCQECTIPIITAVRQAARDVTKAVRECGGECDGPKFDPRVAS